MPSSDAGSALPVMNSDKDRKQRLLCIAGEGAAAEVEIKEFPKVTAQVCAKRGRGRRAVEHSLTKAEPTAAAAAPAATACCTSATTSVLAAPRTACWAA